MPFCLFLLLLLLLLPAGHASVFVPDAADTVLLRVAPSDNAEVQRLRQMRAALAEAPGRIEMATAFAQAAIDHARRSQDARWYGYAEGALRHWQGRERVPAEVRVLRATLAQHDHRFAAALQDLDQVLAQQPQHLQARLTRAVIHSVQGRYAQAITDCNVVRRYRVLMGVACLATPRSLSGRPSKRYACCTRIWRLPRVTTKHGCGRAAHARTLAGGWAAPRRKSGFEKRSTARARATTWRCTCSTPTFCSVRAGSPRPPRWHVPGKTATRV